MYQTVLIKYTFECSFSSKLEFTNTYLAFCVFQAAFWTLGIQD